MGFFDIGPLELLLIFIVVLIVWGPNRLPEIARTLGKTVRAFRRAASDLTATVNREISLEEQKESAKASPAGSNNPAAPGGHKVPEHLETPGTGN